MDFPGVRRELPDECTMPAGFRFVNTVSRSEVSVQIFQRMDNLGHHGLVLAMRVTDDVEIYPFGLLSRDNRVTQYSTLLTTV
jgi:hypothetical protein